MAGILFIGCLFLTGVVLKQKKIIDDLKAEHQALNHVCDDMYDHVKEMV